MFLELRGLEARERAARLEGVEDGALRAEVESLLRFDEPGPAPGGSLEAGARLGPYTLLRRLGRGGTGYVFLAEQTEPVERRVAVKIVPQAMLDAVIAARFEFERRALEQVDHPNIARVLDAGRSSEGLPYLVIEHVDGVPITEYCEEHRLTLGERIALMLDVADAVQHAHQRGLVHRDLTPANILVAEVNGRPMPRVVDFGIARAVEGEGGWSLTAGLPIGTPAYMAPEQAAGAAVDTRADIYALGAVVYELATGGPPLRPGADLAATLERVRLEAPAAVSRARAWGQFVDRPARALLADLDRVVACALEKSPQRRYATVEAFAEDLRRVVRREPVRARPAGAAYRAARFVERHRALVAAAVVVGAALCAGVVGISAGLVEAQRQRGLAQARADALDAVNRFLTEDLLAGASPEESAEGTTAVELLDRAAARVDRRFADRPLIAAEMHHTLGQAYVQLAAFDRAERHLDRAVALRIEHEGADAPATMRSRLARAALLSHRQDFAAGAAALEELVPVARLVLGADDPALYAALNDLGSSLDTLGEGERAAPLLAEALAGRRRLLGEQDPLVLVTVSNLAQAYDGMGQTERALELMHEALRLAREMPEEPRMLLIGLTNNIGATYQDLGEHEAAAPYLREASELAAAWLGPDSPATLTLKANHAGLEARIGDPGRAAELYRDVAEARTALLGADAFDTLAARHGQFNAVMLGGGGAEAARGFEGLLADARRALGEEHWFTAQAQLSLAAALEACGEIGAARAHAEAAQRRFMELFGADHARSRAAVELVERLGPP
jgi:non-specific serine/threonine protein kinase/serine/threonine-protein kinase